jgi:hypothetical protein
MLQREAGAICGPLLACIGGDVITREFFGKNEGTTQDYVLLAPIGSKCVSS